jgi:hypothetical protein
MCPVNVNFSASDAPTEALAKSQILMVRSADPEANISFVGSMARLRTHPKWDDKTVDNFHGECQSGVGILSFPPPPDLFDFFNNVSFHRCNRQKKKGRDNKQDFEIRMTGLFLSAKL